MAKKDGYSFATGSADGLRSSVWRIFRRNNEVYVAPRSVANAMKLSLHSSRVCRFAVTEQHYQWMAEQGLEQPPDRLLVKWNRPETPEYGTLLLATIIMPTDFLRAFGDVPNRRMIWFEPPPSGMAIKAGLFLSQERVEKIEASVPDGTCPVVYTHLPNGETVSLMARAVPFDTADFMKRYSGRRGSATFFTSNQDVGGDTLRVFYLNDPTDDGFLQIIDVAGVTANYTPGKSSGR